MINCALLWNACGDDSVEPSKAGPTNYSGDSLYITVIDESGNPIPNANIYYTCWGPTDANDCRASIGLNSSPIKYDTVTSIYCFPNPVNNIGALQFNNMQEQDITIELLDYTGTRMLAELHNESNAPAGTYMLEMDFSKLDSIIAKTHPQKKGMSNIYRARVRYSKDTVKPTRTVLVWDKSGLMYRTNSSGYVGIAYSSLPFGELINRVTDNGTKIGVFSLQGDYLYVKCKVAGYKDEYAMTNAYARSEREIRITMKK